VIETIGTAPSPELELVLEKLVTDRAFRIAFFADPPAALRLAGLRLCPAERDALAESPLELLDAVAARIG
jgi:hypothetical protein